MVLAITVRPPPAESGIAVLAPAGALNFTVPGLWIMKPAETGSICQSEWVPLPWKAKAVTTRLVPPSLTTVPRTYVFGSDMLRTRTGVFGARPRGVAVVKVYWSCVGLIVSELLLVAGAK